MPKKFHDEIISAILEVISPKNGEIRLLGRVNDSALGNSSDTDIYLFIPDLHMISPSHQSYYGDWGFNHTKDGCLLAEVLKKIAELKNKWDSSGEAKLRTFQLGDFFDLWREFSGKAEPEKIDYNTHGDLRDILYRGVDWGRPCLKATVMLGNHDTKNGVPLQEIPFRITAFNRAADQKEKPFLMALHGDVFSFIETFTPDVIRELFVNLAGNLTPINAYPVGKWGKMACKFNKPISQLRDAITEAEHDLSGQMGVPKVEPEKRLPRIFCQQISSPEIEVHKFFKSIYDLIKGAEKDDLAASQVRVVCIGHTHKAAMVFYKLENQGSPLLLMDVGAWIEKCKYPLAEDGRIVLEPSAQLGVIHGNDARIYQLCLLESRVLA